MLMVSQHVMTRLCAVSVICILAMCKLQEILVLTCRAATAERAKLRQRDTASAAAVDSVGFTERPVAAFCNELTKRLQDTHRSVCEWITTGQWSTGISSKYL